MKGLIYFCSIIFFVFCSCSKEPVEPSSQELYEIALQNLEIKCDDVTSDYYFSGELNGEDLCYFDGHDGYSTYSAIGNIFITEGAVASTNGSQEGISTFGFSFNPTNQKIKERLSIKYLYPSIEDYKHKFISTFLAGNFNFYNKHIQPEGFSIELIVPFKENELKTGNYIGALSTRNGNQSNSEFRIVEIINEENEDFFYGEITFKFSCKLFHSAPFGNGFYGNFSGEMKMDYLFPK